MHYKEIIEIIKKRRKVLKITQERLSQVSGVGLRTLKAIESGEGNPTLKTIAKLADVMGMEVKLEVKKLK